MYNSDLQCMNANNNISINTAARPYQKSCQAKKNMGMFMYNFAKKGFFVGGR